jgi:hypothetical protein
MPQPVLRRPPENAFRRAKEWADALALREGVGRGDWVGRARGTWSGRRAGVGGRCWWPSEAARCLPRPFPALVGVAVGQTLRLPWLLTDFSALSLVCFETNSRVDSFLSSRDASNRVAGRPSVAVRC